jgi:hypothetical protein
LYASTRCACASLQHENKPIVISVQFGIGILQVAKNENPKRTQEGATKKER